MKSPVNTPSEPPANTTGLMIQQWTRQLSNEELARFDRNITRVILFKALVCSVLLICLNLSILGIVDSLDSSLLYTFCAVLSAAALVCVYLTPSSYCAMLLTQTFSWHSHVKHID